MLTIDSIGDLHPPLGLSGVSNFNVYVLYRSMDPEFTKLVQKLSSVFTKKGKIERMQTIQVKDQFSITFNINFEVAYFN